MPTSCPFPSTSTTTTYPGQPDGAAVGGRRPGAGRSRDYIARAFHGMPGRCACCRLHDGKVSIGHDTHHRAAAGLPVRAARLGGVGARVRRPDRLHPPDVHLRARARPAAAVGAVRARRDRVPAVAADRLARGHPPGRELRVWCGRRWRTSSARGCGSWRARTRRPGGSVVRGHSDVIIGWAVSDNEFFEQRRGHRHLPHHARPAEPAGVPGAERRQPLLRHARTGLASGAGAGRGPRRAGHRRLVVLASRRSWRSTPSAIPRSTWCSSTASRQQLLRPAPEGAVRRPAGALPRRRACGRRWRRSSRPRRRR